MLALLALLPLAALAAPRPAAQVVPANVREIVDVFAGLGPRTPGSEGGRAAAQAVEDLFRRLGLKDVERQRFLVPVPVTRDAQLQVGDRAYDVNALAPNFVRLSALPPGVLNGPVVYAGQGQLIALRGLPLDGAIVLVDFNCGHRWLDLVNLGAAAVVFVEPPGGGRSGTSGVNRGEAQRKLLNVPVDVPRFYLGHGPFTEICARAGVPADGRPFALAQGGMIAQADWQAVEASNVLGLIEGSDADLKQELLVVTGYFDSASIVLERGPGAEQASGLAGLLETARVLAANPPRRSVLLAALDGHFQALSGARELADVLRREHTRERWEDALTLMRRHDAEELERLEKLRNGPRDKRLTEEEDAQFRGELDGQIARWKARQSLAQRIHDQYQIVLTIAIDLSSGSDRVGVFHAGHFYGNDKLTRFLAPLGKQFQTYADRAGLGANVQDCITPEQDQNWTTWVPDQFATDAEPFTQAARAALSLFTINDARPLIDTPLDTIDRVRFDQLVPQVQATAAIVAGAANDHQLVSGALKRLHRMPFEYKPINGMIYEFERRKTFLPNTPVPNALIALKNPASAMMGVRPDILAMADARGDFRMVGYPYDKSLKLDAYGIEPGTGVITYAPDRGPEGEAKYPRDLLGRQGLRRPLLVFPCAPLNLFDLVDERYFETLQQIFIYDARTNSEPRTFGYEEPVHSPPARIVGSVSASYVEPVAVIYAPRQTRVKVTMGMGLLGLRLILTGATAQNPEGDGFAPSDHSKVVRTSYQAANDMWVIDDARMARQRTFGISSTRQNDLHAKAKGFLEEARAGLAQRSWEQHLSAARNAWAYEARAYPDVQGIEADTIKGVLFYLAMLLPFAFFAERILFASPRIKEQILWTVAVFLVVYTCLRYVHPAFQLLDTPWIILLGFIIMTLASVVIAIVSRRFNEELEALKEASGGQHQADVSRAGTLGAAFTLGISNMRRRPLRTALTAITLTLLTFTVLSFTSVQATLRANARAAGTRQTYPGLLVRDPVWSALEAPTARILETQFEQSGLVTPRGWLTSAQLDKQMKLAIRNGTKAFLREGGLTEDETAAFGPLGHLALVDRLPDHLEPLTINAILGLTPDEPRVSGLGSKLTAGRWFGPGEMGVCIVPESVAKTLDLGPGSSSDKLGLGYGAVEVFGSRLKVVGVVADERLGEVTDLDGESLTPVDFSALEPEKLRLLQEQQAQRLRLGSAPPPPIDRYSHFPPASMIIMPFDRLMSIGGTLRSVAVRFRAEDQVKPAAAALMDRFELSAYAGAGGKVELYSSIGVTSVGGLETVIIPLVIAALIVLNTMLGAVAERLTEIGIFSSIGLAPAHVAMLFLSESCVFANIGVIIGYLGGQTIAKLLFWAQTNGWMSGLAGLSLNYSSTAAVGVAIIIIATVLLSTVYPAKKAARMATPDVERRWKLPQPDGHLMRFSLPFMLTGMDGVACNMFLKEYFDGYVDFAGGDFYTDGTALTASDDGELCLALTVWLAPYDLGVSQRVRLLTTPDPDDPHVRSVEIAIERISGDDTSWLRTNWLFINILRQQFLLWRTISPGQKLIYADQGVALIEGREWHPETAETPLV